MSYVRIDEKDLARLQTALNDALIKVQDFVYMYEKLFKQAEKYKRQRDKARRQLEDRCKPQPLQYELHAKFDDCTRIYRGSLNPWWYNVPTTKDTS